MTARPLSLLTEEHRCLLRLADALENEIQQLTEHPTPDYARLLLWADRLEQRFIRHQRRDQLVVDQLLARAGRARPLLETFINSHGLRFREALNGLRRDLDAILHDQLRPRTQVLQQARAVIGHLRTQIVSEEEATLPWAHERLAQRQWRQIDAALAASPAACTGDPT